MRNHSLKFYSGRKLRESVILAFFVILVLAGFFKAWAQGEKEILNEIKGAREDIEEAKKTIEENTASIREIQSGLDELKKAIIKLEYSDSTQKEKISEIKNNLSRLAGAAKDSRDKLSEIEEKLSKTSYPRKAEGETSYIIGCTVDKSDSSVRISDVSVRFFFRAGSVDSLSLKSGPDGRFSTALPIGVGDYLIYEVKKPDFKPTIGSLTISSNPLLLQIPLSEQYPTRRISVAIKTRYNWKWERKLRNRTLKLKWGGKIQRSYETDESGFIPAVEVPLGNEAIEYQVLYGEVVEKNWEPMVSSKIPRQWKILVPSPK